MSLSIVECNRDSSEEYHQAHLETKCAERFPAFSIHQTWKWGKSSNVSSALNSPSFVRLGWQLQTIGSSLLPQLGIYWIRGVVRRLGSLYLEELDMVDFRVFAIGIYISIYAYWRLSMSGWPVSYDFYLWELSLLTRSGALSVDSFYNTGDILISKQKD